MHNEEPQKSLKITGTWQFMQKEIKNPRKKYY